MNNPNIELFSERVKKHRTMVFRIAYGYVKDTHDADDITQEVFLKLYKSTEDFAADENVKAWLIRVTINCSKSLLRTAWRVKRELLDEFTATVSPPEDCIELYEYIENLKPKYRSVIYLYYYEQYSVREIAEILKIRDTTVTTQLGRARAQLKQMFAEEGTFTDRTNKRRDNHEQPLQQNL